MTNEELLKAIIKKAGAEIGLALEEKDIVIEHAKDPAHGDYSTNAAMRFCRLAGCKPVDLASRLLPHLQDEMLDRVEIAGPGFLNFFLKHESLQSVVAKAIQEGDDYGRGEKKGTSINVEYVSANPTGDLHLGHTRIAAVGDAIASLLAFAGYDVTREFYVNDCGNQVEHLGRSLRERYHELFGEEIHLGDDDYHGVDLINIAQSIKDQYGDKYLADTQESHDFFIRFGIDAELGKLKKDLAEFRVYFDKFTYESDIRKGGNIEKTLENLKPYLYEKDGATFLKTTEFGDDKDRPVVKSDGLYTYFMPDICYHYDKVARGFDALIDIFGADHGGYVARLKAALSMKGIDPNILEVQFVQIVRTFRDGVEVKMSKRTGKAIAHRDLIEDVGTDAVRYFFTERSPSSHLDFNYDLALEKSSSNPVYYAQYAHARCASLLSLGSDIGINEKADLCKSEPELALIKEIAAFPGIVASSAEERAPYKIAAYSQKLAAAIHAFYHECKIIDREQPELTASRLALVKAAKIAMHNALAILGVSSPEKM